MCCAILVLNVANICSEKETLPIDQLLLTKAGLLPETDRYVGKRKN
jgi:hypothetical protein